MARICVDKPVDPIQAEAELRSLGYEITQAEETPDTWNFYFIVHRRPVDDEAPR